MADYWVYYDANGNRVLPAQARFRGKEVEIDGGGPTPPGHDPLTFTRSAAPNGMRSTRGPSSRPGARTRTRARRKAERIGLFLRTVPALSGRITPAWKDIHRLQRLEE
jgi:hypothetical protein